MELLQTQLDHELVPDLTKALTYREGLIADLLKARKARRRRREARVKALNKLMGGIVRIKILRENDDSAYLADLSAIAKGSRLRGAVLEKICKTSSPVKLVRSFLAGDVDGVCTATGVERKYIEILFEHVSEQGAIEDLLRIQTLDVAVQPWWRDYAAVVMAGVRAGGSHAPVVNSRVIASRVSRSHLVAVDR